MCWPRHKPIKGSGNMSRTSLLLLVAVFGLFSSPRQCQAQVGFGAVQQWINSGARMNVTPVVTNNRRYARLGMSVGVSQLVDVQTFSPVQGFPRLAPVNTIGFGFVGGDLNTGVGQLYRGRNSSETPAIRKPKSTRFIQAAWKFDTDKDAKLKGDELSKLSAAVIAELKRDPAVYRKLRQVTEGRNKTAKLITEAEVAEVFLEQCLKYDRDKDNALSPSETDVLALALIRFLK